MSPILKDSNRGFVSWPELPKIRAVFTNATNPHESWRILSTIARNESLRIQAGGFANPDSRIRTLKICFVDLFRRHVFERFVSWIFFVDSFLKDSFRGFVSCKQKSQKIRFLSIRKDSCTNPASLQICYFNLKPFEISCNLLLFSWRFKNVSLCFDEFWITEINETN